MSQGTFPLVILVGKNGQRDRLDADACLEFVFAKDRAIRVSLDGDRVVVSEVRSGVVASEHVDRNTLTVTSE